MISISGMADYNYKNNKKNNQTPSTTPYFTFISVSGILILETNAFISNNNVFFNYEGSEY